MSEKAVLQLTESEYKVFSMMNERISEIEKRQELIIEMLKPLGIAGQALACLPFKGKTKTQTAMEIYMAAKALGIDDYKIEWRNDLWWQRWWR